MRVLMFGWEFPPFVSGGLGTACYGISRGLVHNNVDVSFVLPTKRHQHIESDIRLLAADEIGLSSGMKRFFSKRGINTLSEKKPEYSLSPYYTRTFYTDVLKRLESVQRLTDIEKKTSLLDFTGNYGKDLKSEVFKFSIIGEYLGLTGEFDVIHAHDWLTYPAGVAAKSACGKPLVIHVHATEFDRSGENINQEIYDIERYGMEHADRIIAVSYYTKSIIVKRYGIPAEKVDVVHNAVDKNRQIEKLGLKRNINEKIVLFLGRVTMQKGPDYFIEAANLVLKKLKNVRFVMAGSGDMLPRMITRMASLGIGDRFHFVGFLERLKVEKIFAMSDLYVMPSVSEPFGISPFEALLYDVPIIISRQSGVAEILKNAVLVDFWDIEKLADKMIQLLKDERLAAQVVESCKAEIQNIEWNNAAGRIRDIYYSLI